jgi:hypothetical protein
MNLFEVARGDLRRLANTFLRDAKRAGGPSTAGRKVPERPALARL